MRIAFFTFRDALFNEISQAFEQSGISCTRFTDERSMFRLLQRNATDLIIFDATQSHLPVLAAIKWRTCHFRDDLPVMMIGRAWNCPGVIEALDAGVDEIALDTASIAEIKARTRRLIARRRLEAIERVTVAGYTVDRAARTIRFRDHCASLTARELSLAWLLFTNPGKLMSREQLAAAVWGKGADLAGRSLEQHIYKLRSKLALDDRSGPRLQTVYGLGYLFMERSHIDNEFSDTLASMAA
ncbi:winged helix-turn-helix transcriptional regulator [Paraburkholderia terrae]|uniref:winged helix-turn-helix transcriptional regulator n=1 Tax=Paraburkholderia terrae TaxID=311230 RepID=UPI00206E905A|nr:response regulator transcription factor [Paraburkholderia terrae]BDC45200.1 transcriptional regulator [Paraburkholderia terrae]